MIKLSLPEYTTQKSVRGNFNAPALLQEKVSSQLKSPPPPPPPPPRKSLV